MGNLFEEMRRRNVFRVAVAYGIVGWIVVQITDVAVPALLLPEWVPTLVFYLGLVGFPFAMLFAWAFEMTPEGIKKSKDVETDTSVAGATGGKLDRMIIAGLVLVVGFLLIDRFTGGPEGTGTPVAETQVAETQVADTSIAVLPFVNMSSDPEQVYFSDGISEEILNVLAQIPDLHVTSRSSAFQFRGNDIHIPTVAETLGVAHILEGSVRKSGLRVRITAQLIEASTDKHLWSETYDRDLTDIFAVQDEISVAIVEALKETMGLEAAAPTKVIAAANAEAYDAYLLGVHQMEKRGAGPLAEAAAHFERAIAIDPDYAPARARLGMTYVLLTIYDFENHRPAETNPKALRHLERALKLAPDLPESQAGMGFYLSSNDLLEEAEPYFKRAIALNPSYATAHVWLGSLYNDLMRFDEALARKEQAVRADPLSALALTNLIGDYSWLNMPEKAAPLMARLRQISPLFYENEMRFLAELEGRVADAALGALRTLATDRNYNNASGGFSLYLSNAFGLYQEDIEFGFFPDKGYYGLGRTQDILSMLKEVESTAPDDLGLRGFIGVNHWIAGDLAKARENLESAWQDIPDGPGKAYQAFYNGILVNLAAVRMDAGDSAGTKALTDQALDIIARERAAGAHSGDQYFREALLHLNAGRDEEGMQALAEAFDRHYILDYTELHHLTRYPHLDFEPVLAAYRARMATERDKFLGVVCNGGNPRPDVWSPMPETCEGYVTE